MFGFVLDGQRPEVRAGLAAGLLATTWGSSILGLVAGWRVFVVLLAAGMVICTVVGRVTRRTEDRRRAEQAADAANLSLRVIARLDISRVPALSNGSGSSGR